MMRLVISAFNIFGALERTPFRFQFSENKLASSIEAFYEPGVNDCIIFPQGCVRSCLVKLQSVFFCGGIWQPIQELEIVAAG